MSMSDCSCKQRVVSLSSRWVPKKNADCVRTMCNYDLPRRGSGVLCCMCLCVCLSAIVSSLEYVQTSPDFVHVTHGRAGSVLLRWRSDTLRISGFMDDVVFAHKLIGCSTSPPGRGSKAHTQPWAWRVGIPVAGSRHSGLLLAVRAY